MEHPLIGDISNLTIDALSTKVNDLTQKLLIAQNLGNGALCNQLRMAIETYHNKYQEKLKEQYESQKGSFEKKINIT